MLTKPSLFFASIAFEQAVTMQFAGNQLNGYSSDIAKLRNCDIDYPSHNDNEPYKLPTIM